MANANWGKKRTFGKDRVRPEADGQRNLKVKSKPTTIFFDRKDLLVGSIIAATVGPFSFGPMIDALQSFVSQQKPGWLFMIFGVSCYVYVVARSVLDIVSDVAELRLVRGLLSTILPKDIPAASNPRNAVKIVTLMAEAILLGGGAVVFFVFDPSRPQLLPDLDLSMFGQFAIAIGALTFYERNVTLLYPFHFLDWLGLDSERVE